MHVEDQTKSDLVGERPMLCGATQEDKTEDGRTLSSVEGRVLPSA